MAAAVAIVAVGALPACSSVVEVSAGPRSGEPSCRAAAVAYPATVAGLSARAVSTSTGTEHAWGDPAVVARCGFDPPGPTTDECLGVDDVDWVVRRLTDGVSFTTYGRDPALEVLVPSTYAPESLLLPAFSAAARALPETGRRCS